MPLFSGELRAQLAPKLPPEVAQPLSVAPLTVGAPDKVMPVGRLSATEIGAVVGPFVMVTAIE